MRPKPRRNHAILAALVALFLISTSRVAQTQPGPVGHLTGTIDLVSGGIISGNVLTANNPSAITSDPTSGLVYVAEADPNSTVYTVNPANNFTRIPILAGIQASSMLLDPDNHLLYVADAFTKVNVSADEYSGPGQVLVIQPSTDKVIDTIPSDPLIFAMTYDPADRCIYLAGANDNRVSVLNTTSGSVVGAVAVGHDPQGITYDSSNQLLYVANYRGNSVSVIDTRTDSVIANVSPVTSPYRVLYNPVAQDVLVLSSNLTSVQPQSPSLYVISTSSESVVSTSNLGIDPIDAAFDPDNSRIYVADAPNFVTPAANSIVTLDAQTNTPIGNLSTGFGTNYLSYDAANKRLIMLDSSEGGLSVFNPTTGTVLHRIPIAIAGAPDFVFDPINSNLYTTGCYLGCQGSMLYSFSPTGISEYQLGTYADSTGEDTQVIALDTSSGLLYITDGFSAGVTVFDPSTGETVGRLAFSGYTPYYNFFEAATYDPSSGLLYIVDSPGSGDGSLIAVNVTSGLITKTLNLGTALTGIIYDRANGDLYVEGASVLNVVDGQKDSLLGKISLPGTAPNGNPYTMVLDPTSTVIYALVSESVGKSDVMIATISTATNSVSGTVDVSTLAGSGIFNGYPALDPQNGYLYLALDTANDVGEVAVLNLGSGALVDTIPVGLFPYGGAYDPSNGEIYVGGAYGMISVIQTPLSGVTTSSTTTTTSSTTTTTTSTKSSATTAVTTTSSSTMSSSSSTATSTTTGASSATTASSTSTTLSAPISTTSSTSSSFTSTSSSSSSASSSSVSWNYLAVVAVNATLLAVLGGIVMLRVKKYWN